MVKGTLISVARGLKEKMEANTQNVIPSENIHFSGSHSGGPDNECKRIEERVVELEMDTAKIFLS